MKKIISCFLAYIIIISTLTFPSKAAVPEAADNTKFDSLENAQSESEHINQYPQKNDLSHIQIESCTVLGTEPVKIKLSTSNLLNYSYTADGISVTESHTNGICFFLNPNQEISSFIISTNNSDGSKTNETIYLFHTHNMTFASEFTLDDALHNGMSFLYDQGLVTYYEWEQKYRQLTMECIQQFDIGDGTNIDHRQISSLNISTTATSNTLIVSGYIYWMPSSDSIMPLKCTRVTLFEHMQQLYYSVGDTYTNLDGYFYFEIDIANLSLYEYDSTFCIRIKNESRTIDVSSLQFPYFEYEFTGKPNVGKEYSIGGIVISHSQEMSFYRSMYIHQCMVVGERFALEMGMNIPNEKVLVKYPFTKDQAASWAGKIYIGENEYLDHDTIVHEYAHYVQQTENVYGSTLFEIITNWPTHNPFDDQLSENWQKEYAMELVWSEAWATVFSAISQTYYSSEYSSAISSWGNFYHNSINFEEPEQSDKACEFQEIAITAFLWDLYDDAESTGVNELHDRINWSARTWWNSTMKPGTCTLTDFIGNVEVYYSSYLDEIGSIMSKYQISSSQLTIQNKADVSLTIPPVLTWQVNGSQKYANDTFTIHFYDAYGNELGSTDYILKPNQTPSDVVEYSVPTALWSQIVKDYAGSFTLQISVKSSFVVVSPQSGPYPSEYVSLSIEYPSAISPFLAKTRYIEKTIKLDKGQHFDLMVHFETSGPKLIQTFGSKDTKLSIYSEEGTLIASNDDDGYGRNALISINTEALTQYTIRIQFYSSTTYGTTKIAITPANTARTSGTAITSYENITNIQNVTSYQTTIILNENSTTVVRFTPKTSGRYTIKTTGDYDTYLYIIDPRSHEKNSTSNYNDDGGDVQNASLTIELDANVSYLIVISPYNPSTVDDFIGCKLHINLNQ